MGKNLKNKNLSFYGKKRNLILFFLLGMLVVIIAVFLILFFNKIDNNLLITLSLIAITAYLILFVFLRNKFLVYDTYYQYLLMIENKKDPYKLTMKLFTARWIKKIEEYKLKVDNNEFRLYSKYIKKHAKPLRMRDTLVLVIVAKVKNFDFYSTAVETEIEKLHRDKQKIRRQIALQFQRYESLDEEAINEVDQIINFKNGQNQMIHISVGYSDKSNELYFLEPKKRYPSKYYFFACEMIKDLTNIRE